jgi:hypothetical protein
MEIVKKKVIIYKIINLLNYIDSKFVKLISIFFRL